MKAIVDCLLSLVLPISLPNCLLVTVSGGNFNYENVHEDNLPGVEGTNLGIKKDLEALQEHVAALDKPDSPFWFINEVWKNYRLGQVGRVTPQGSKIARSVMGMKSHKVQVKIGDAKTTRYFNFALAQSLGVGIDKLIDTAIMEQLAEQLANPDIKAGIEAIIRFKEGNSAKGDSALITAAVLEAGEDTHSLEGLIAAANQSMNPDSFSTTLSIEADGITNGTAISMILYAGGAKWEDIDKVLKSAGIFTDDSVTSYGEWISEAGNRDVYEQTVSYYLTEQKVLMDLIHGTKDKIPYHTAGLKAPIKTSMDLLDESEAGKTQAERIAKLAALDTFIGEMKTDEGDISKDARKLVKYPVMFANFGAEIRSIVNTLKDDVQGTFRKQLEEARSEEDFALIQKNIELASGLPLMSEDGKSELTITDENRLSVRLSDEQIDALNITVEAYMGGPLEVAMDTAFGDLKEHRKVINMSMDLTHAMFTLHMEKEQQALKESKLNKMIADGHIELASDTAAARERAIDKVILTEEEIIKIADGLNDTSASIKHFLSGDELNQEMLFSKYDRATNYHPEFTVQSNVGQGIPGTHYEGSPAGQSWPQRSFVSHPKFSIYSYPGLSTAILIIHGSDGAIQYQVMPHTEALNVHDAYIGSIASVEELFALQNQAFFDTVSQYNPATLVNEKLHYAYNKLLKSPKLVTELNKILALKSKADYRFLGKDFMDGKEPKYTSAKQFITEATVTTKQDIEPVKQAYTDKITGLSQYHTETPDGLHKIKDAPVTTDNNIEALLKTEFQVITLDEFMEGMQTLQTEEELGNYIYDNFTEDIISSIESQKLSTPYFTNDQIMDMLGDSDAYYNTANSRIDPKTFQPDTTENLSPQNSTKTFKGLANVGNKTENKKHSKYLGNVLKLIINPVLSTLTLAQNAQEGPTEGVWHSKNGEETIYLSTGKGSLSAAINMSAQEGYIHELLHAITHFTLNSKDAWLIRKEVRRLYDHVKSQVTPEDFMTYNLDGTVKTAPGTTALDERARAQERYDYIFGDSAVSIKYRTDIKGNRVAVTKDVALDEFIAHGGSNEAFIKKLATIKGLPDASLKGASAIETLFNIIKKIFDFVTGNIVSSDSVTADEQLMDLVTKLSNVKESSERSIFNQFEITAGMNKAVQKGISTYVTKPMVKLLDSGALDSTVEPGTNGKGVGANLKNAAVGVARITARQMKLPVSMDIYKEVILQLLDNLNTDYKETIYGVIDEMTSPKTELYPFIDHLLKKNKRVEKDSLEAGASIAAFIRSTMSKPLSHDKSVAVTKAFLKTDTVVLMDHYGAAKVEEFLRDPALPLVPGSTVESKAPLSNNLTIGLVT